MSKFLSILGAGSGETDSSKFSMAPLVVALVWKLQSFWTLSSSWHLFEIVLKQFNENIKYLVLNSILTCHFKIILFLILGRNCL